jgi:hypothetical protein
MRYELGSYIQENDILHSYRRENFKCILHSHRSENLKSHIALTGWAL